MAAWRIPLSDVDLGLEEEEAVQRVIRSGWLSAGEETSNFEREFAQFLSAGNGVAVSSGTAALHLACLALGVRAGVDVIVPTMTFVATANAVVLAGGRPVFCESVGPEDLTINPTDVERRLTPSTRGIVCVHYGGFPCQLDELLHICERHDLFLIEDVAHAPGAKWKGRALGTMGDVGCFSFFANKNMTTGEGGMAVARDSAVAERIRLLRGHGMTTSSWDRFRGQTLDYDVMHAGLNYRPTELAAAVGRVQLRKLTSNNERRNALFARYRSRLASTPSLGMPFAGKHGAAHLAPVLAGSSNVRRQLRAAMTKAAIQTSVHYPPVHLLSYYAAAYGFRPGDLPVAEDLAARVLTLPLYPTMTDAQVDDVCDVAVQVAGQAACTERTRARAIPTGGRS